MGRELLLSCKKCSYLFRESVGIGIYYPQVCHRLLGDIKTGAYGEAFRETANSDPHAAVYTDTVLMRCPSCGSLEAKQRVSLCVPIGEYRPRTTVFSSACTGIGMAYVLGNELGKTYREVVSLPGSCSHCGKPMELVKDTSKLHCPRCGEGLTPLPGTLWD